jgi:glycerophosphoryl diester phosphodiesterase
MKHVAVAFLAVAMAGCVATPQPSEVGTMKRITVIAHRGASGYLPEHTLEAAAMAHAMRADYIEQDVVLTRDDQLIVLHDLYLDEVTDVAERYPGRHRSDGRHYAIDFTLAEIRQLRVTGRDRPGAPSSPDGPVLADAEVFRVPTLAEEMELIRQLNRSTGHESGLYIEPKSPAWHTAEGKNLMAAVLDLLADFGLTDASDPVLLQSFDAEALMYARGELGSRLRMVQLIGENSWRESPSDFDFLQTSEGLAGIAGYAQGIGPWIPQVVEFLSNESHDISDLVARAHAAGLFVHAYTLRADQLPKGAGTLSKAVHVLVDEVGIDGVFTDHPDQVIRLLPDADRK